MNGNILGTVMYKDTGFCKIYKLSFLKLGLFKVESSIRASVFPFASAINIKEHQMSANVSSTLIDYIQGPYLKLWTNRVGFITLPVGLSGNSRAAAQRDRTAVMCDLRLTSALERPCTEWF